LRTAHENDAALAVSRALSFLRSCAALPFGVAEAQSIADIIHDSDDEIDLAVRAMFRPKMALAKLAAIAATVPAHASQARALTSAIQGKVAAWENETPVSAKLTSLLDAAPEGGEGILVVVHNRRISDLFILSDRVKRWRISVVAADSLAAELDAKRPRQLIVVGPVPETLQALLTSADVPSSVMLLGDSSGMGLLAAELSAIERLPEFAPLVARTSALRAALTRGGGDESLDLSEASFHASELPVTPHTDFTRSGEGYAGDTVQIQTRHSVFTYRPTSTVLVHSAGELRPFVASDAKRIRVGDAILALGPDIHETLRRAISGSRKSRDELAVYHKQVAARRNSTPGLTLSEKAHYVIEQMKQLDPSVQSSEWVNVRRWLSADLAAESADGSRQPGAARKWERFRTFWAVGGVSELVADMYWRMAIMPTRSYRIQEGYAFNQRVTHFVLDPEGTALGAGQWAAMPHLWQLVEASVDEVIDVKLQPHSGTRTHG
jgi:hypothetical protein